MYEQNPFTPTFGTIPPYMAGRDKLLSEMRNAFKAGPGNPNLSTILIGARGTGKTALLSCIAEEAKQEGWLAINVVASTGMLEDILQQTGKAASHLIEKKSDRKLSGIGIGQLLNLEWVFEKPEIANWRSRMDALFEKLSEYDSGLLITVDEVRVDVEEMIQLVSTYQLFVREGKKIALVMAGLLDATYREMSSGDRAFALAMCGQNGGRTISEIAQRMGKGTNYASTYKRRLMKQGVISERPDGKIEFEVPFFEEYLQAMR